MARILTPMPLLALALAALASIAPTASAGMVDVTIDRRSFDVPEIGVGGTFVYTITNNLTLPDGLGHMVPRNISQLEVQIGDVATVGDPDDVPRNLTLDTTNLLFLLPFGQSTTFSMSFTTDNHGPEIPLDSGTTTVSMFVGWLYVDPITQIVVPDSTGFRHELDVQITVRDVPEPGSMILLATGVGAIAIRLGMRRRLSRRTIAPST